MEFYFTFRTFAFCQNILIQFPCKGDVTLWTTKRNLIVLLVLVLFDNDIPTGFAAIEHQCNQKHYRNQWTNQIDVPVYLMAD